MKENNWTGYIVICNLTFTLCISCVSRLVTLWVFACLLVSDLDESAPPVKNLTLRLFINVSDIGLRSDPRPYAFNDNPNLEWQWFSGSLPNGAVGIWNGYTSRYDYVCRTFDGCETGFYYSDYGECLFTRYPDLYGTNGFYILVNKDNFEFLEWKSGSYGSVPTRSVRTCSSSDQVYVGKNEYGLGLIQAGDSFYLPWVQDFSAGQIYGYATWYRQSYQGLTINTDKYSQKLLDIEYYIDQAEIIKTPPFAVDEHTVSNKDCNTAKMSTTLSTTQTKTNKWQISYSMSLSTSTSVTAGIPEIFGGEINIGVQQTFQTSSEISVSQSQSNSLNVEISVSPNTKCTIKMQGRKYTVDIPYKARLGRTYVNGDTKWTTITGTYKGVQVTDYSATIERCEPLEDPVPCENLKHVSQTSFSCQRAPV